MRHGVESQGLLEQLSIELQELAGVGRASIRDDKAEIQILRMLGKFRDEALLREVHHNNAMLNFKIFRDTASYLNQCGFPPGHQYYVDSRGRGLSRELSPYSRRGTRDECPRAELLFIKQRFHASSLSVRSNSSTAPITAATAMIICVDFLFIYSTPFLSFRTVILYRSV